MSAAIPAAGGVAKPAANGDGRPVGGKAAGRKHQQHAFVKKEKFLGADQDLQGFVFETKTTRSQQITNFRNVDERIRDQVGAKFDEYVLETLERMKVTLPPEPTPVTQADGTIAKIEELKFKSQYDRHLSRVERINTQLRQVYSKYIGQCDAEMKATLKEDSRFDEANKKKDVVELRKMLMSANHNYRTHEEPIKTIWTAKRDFINLRQHRNESVQEYYERFIGMKEVNETLCPNIDSGLIDVICKDKNVERMDLDTDTKKS